MLGILSAIAKGAVSAIMRALVDAFQRWRQDTAYKKLGATEAANTAHKEVDDAEARMDDVREPTAADVDDSLRNDRF